MQENLKHVFHIDFCKKSMDFGGLNANQVMAGAAALNTDAKNYENSRDLEMQWAIKAYHHAETYYNLLCSVDSSLLKLTSKDDKIYTHFRQEFPDLDVRIVKEDDLKKDSSKEKWREFVKQYDGEIEDYNFGTLLRIDSAGDISDANTIFALRIQFLAIEIARNREGHNALVKKMKHEES